MKRCVIVGGADIGNYGFIRDALQPDDYIIFCDSGLKHLDALQVQPSLIVGDFDSHENPHLDVETLVLPCEKDDTDAMLAVRCGLEAGCREFIIYGGVEGPRLEHTVANFQTLLFLAEQGAGGFLIGQNQIVSVLSAGEMIFPKTAKGYLSVFCLGQDATGVSLEGVKYPMTNGTLTAGFPLGVSNRFLGTEARIRVQSGRLLVIWDRANGLPQVDPENEINL